MSAAVGGTPVAQLAIRRLEAGGRIDAAAIDEFLRAHESPIVEGRTCTFLYRGEADAVFLQHFIFAVPTRQPFHRIPRTDLWYYVMELPENSRVEYKLDVVTAGRGRWIEDPLNPHHARDPFGSNSVVHGLGYEEPAWTRPDPEARQGALADLVLHSRHLPGERRVTVYLPARFRRTREYPLLVVHDGGDYLQFSAMKTVLDNLIHRLEIPEMIVALTYPQDRLIEYANDGGHARYLTEELVPHLASDFPLMDRPEGRGLMGASFGAVASFSTASRFPGFYSRLLVQSGSFAFTDIGANPRGPAFEPVVEFMNEYRRNPVPIADKVFVSCGTYESLIYENRSIVPLLQSTGMDVRYSEARDGHNWENWRDRMREGLSWLFPGPLWMVYE